MRERLSTLRWLARLILRERAWWMVPIVLGLSIVALLILLATATPAAPFLYPLF